MMEKFLALLFLFSFLFIHGSPRLLIDYPYGYCSDTTLPPNSTFFPNLKTLSSLLSSNASRKLYHKSSVGRPPNPTAYGDFQCRGDLNASACRKCVATATSNLSQLYCPFSVEAVVWFDECLLRYSNRSFFSTVDEKPLLILTSTDVIDEDMDGLNQVISSTMNDTVGNASSLRGSLKFATKEANFRDATVYTLAQCTGDLSNSKCGKCLGDALRNLPDYCSGKKGCRFLYSSCTIRYELYPFYGGVSPSSISTPPASAPVPALPPLPESPSDSNPSPEKSPSPPAASNSALPPSLPSSPSAPAPSTAAPPLLSGKGRWTVAMVMGIVFAVYFP